MTMEEYLELERAALEKSEFVDGELFQLTPSTARHSMMSVNLLTAISNETEARCFTCNLRVLVVPDQFIAYPDMSAVTSKIMSNADDDVLLNPAFLAEVVSPKTRDHDRGYKAYLYRQMPTVLEFLLVDELEVHVERYSRQADRSWIIADFQELGDVIRLESLGCSVAVAEIYDKVEDF